METVESLEGLLENFSRLEGYLCEGSPEEQGFARILLKKGKSFVSYEFNGESRFAPSRYIGYKANSFENHIGNKSKDGGITNRAISRVLGSEPNPSQELDHVFQTFTMNIGIKPDNNRRRYWKVPYSIDLLQGQKPSFSSFPEGRVVERIHVHRERNPRLVKVAKEKFLREHGRLFCIACGFDFEKVYGDRGHGYIEAHHTEPLSEMNIEHETRPEELAMVCSNCHAMLHRTRPWLGMDALGELIRR